jgi:hypothetical protein
VAAGPLNCPSSVTRTADGANQVVSGTITDGAGHSASVSVTLNIDKTAPIVVLTAPGNLTTASATVELQASVSDGPSGLANQRINSSVDTSF